MNTHAIEPAHKVAHRTPDVAPLRVRAAPPTADGKALQRKATCACGGGCPRCREHQAAAAAPDTGAAMRAAERSGAPLPAELRSQFEERFEHDFSGVRVHADGESAAAARAVQARAYTIGRDIVFGAGEYAPATGEGRRLLAHELAHVVQQSAHGTGIGRAGTLEVGPAHDAAEVEADRVADAVSHGTGHAAAVSAQPMRISRAPVGSAEVHEELIEDYRAAHGWPPHGMDPATGAPEGPTDSEIRFTLLNPWVRGKVGVPAPAKAPTLVQAGQPGRKDVKTDCKKDNPGDEDAYHACRRHFEYVYNILPPAIANIRSVASPYSAAIAKLYDSVLPIARITREPSPGGPSKFAQGFPGPLTFGATTNTFASFNVGFHQRPADADGAAQNFGGNNFLIDLNETTTDAALFNLPVIEDTLVHEAMHVFMWVVQEKNAARPAGTAAADTNLDPASYATLESRLERAVLPFVTQIRQLPSFAGQPHVFTAQDDAARTAHKLIAETLGFVEAGIFTKQRARQRFSAAELASLPPFLYSFAYWEPQPPVMQELSQFLENNRAQIDRDVKPIVFQVGEQYLSLRPA